MQFQRILEQYEAEYYWPDRAMDLFTADLYNILNDYEDEPQDCWIAQNAFDAWALFMAVDEDRLRELSVQI